MENKDKFLNLLNNTYKCKPDDLESLMKKIELAIKNSKNDDKFHQTF